MADPYVPALNVCQVNLNYLWRNLRAANTLYVRKVGSGWTVPEMNQLGAEVESWQQQYIRPQQGNECILVSLDITDLTTQSSPSVEYTGTLPAPGLDATDTVANSTALCVTFETAGRGRSSRGRNYVPGLRRANQVENSWTQPQMDAIVLAYRNILLDEIFSTGEWVVISRRANKQVRPTALIQPVITATYSTLTIATVRERLN